MVQRGNGHRRQSDTLPYVVLLGICLIAFVAIFSAVHHPQGPAVMPTENVLGQAFTSTTASVELCGRRIFIDDRDTPGQHELYSEDMATGAITKLSPPMPPNQNVFTFQISPDGQRIAFTSTHADPPTAGTTVELYSVPINGGAVVKLNHRFRSPADEDVEGSYQFTPDSQHIVYQAGSREHSTLELFSAQSDRAGTGKRISSSDLISTDRQVARVNPPFRISCDGQTVYYLSSSQLRDAPPLLVHSVSINGGVSATLPETQLPILNCPAPPAPACDPPASSCTPTGSACGASEGCCSGICSLGACVDALPECETDDWCASNERCESNTCVPVTLATAQFSADTATCTRGFGRFFCAAAISFTSEGQGYIQLWREGGSQYACTPAGTPLARSLIATHQLRTYVLYAATDCEPENADRRVALDTIIVGDDTISIPDPVDDQGLPPPPPPPPTTCENGHHLADDGTCTPDDIGTTVDHQLSNGQSFSDLLTYPAPAISPDGKYAVYAQDATADNAFDLWSVPLAGGEPIKLTTTASRWGRAFKISPDSTKVVVVGAGDMGLYSVPITGGSPIALHTEFVEGAGQLGDFLISPTSERVYYIADGPNVDVFELWRVDINGGPSTRLNKNFAVNYDVFSFQIARNPDGTDQIVYHVGRTVQGGHELWSVSGTGSSRTAFKINTAFIRPGTEVPGPYYQISEDGSTAVYRADIINDNRDELYSVSVVGGPSVHLNGELNARENVEPDFLISPDGNTVVYRSDERIDNIEELYSVPTRGGTITKLNGPLTSNGDVDTYAISPDNQYVVYTADQDQDSFLEIYSVPINGGTVTKLNGPLVRGTTIPNPLGGDVRTYAISPDSTRVIYIADQDVDDRFEIYSVPINGGTPTKINIPLTNNGNVKAFQLTKNSAHIIYGIEQGPSNPNTAHVNGEQYGTGTLYSVPIAGGTSTKINGRTATTSDVTLTHLGRPIFSIAPNDNDVIYIANGTQHAELHVATIG